jgi:hypothetical protein
MSWVRKASTIEAGDVALLITLDAGGEEGIIHVRRVSKTPLHLEDLERVAEGFLAIGDGKAKKAAKTEQPVAETVLAPNGAMTAVIEQANEIVKDRKRRKAEAETELATEVQKQPAAKAEPKAEPPKVEPKAAEPEAPMFTDDDDDFDAKPIAEAEPAAPELSEAIASMPTLRLLATHLHGTGVSRDVFLQTLRTWLKSGRVLALNELVTKLKDPKEVEARFERAAIQYYADPT